MNAAKERPDLLDVQDYLCKTKGLCEALFMAIEGSTMEAIEKDALTALADVIQERTVQAEKMISVINQERIRPRIAHADRRAG